MSTIVVLLPNNQRQTVKVTPTSTLQSVIASVCEKQKLNKNDYQLFHKDKMLDSSLSVRFANLPSGVKLDLCRVENRNSYFILIVRVGTSQCWTTIGC